MSRSTLPPRTAARSSGREAKRLDLGEFYAGMQPGPVRAEQDFPGAGALDRLLEDVEATYAGGIGKNIPVPDQMVDQRALRPPIVGETSEMRNDERHVGIFVGKDFGGRNLAHDIVQDWQPVTARGFADFARYARVVAMNLDADESPARTPPRLIIISTRPLSSTGCTKAKPIRRPDGPP